MNIVGRSESKELPVPPKVAAAVERQRARRFLVIGSDGHGRSVEGRKWDKLGTGVKVADFDVVILDFSAFESDKGLAEGFPLNLLPKTEDLTRLLFSEGSEVIAIGDPATLIGPPPPAATYDERLRADYWLPHEIITEENSGATFKVTDEDWGFHFANLSSYHWTAAGEMRQQVGGASEYFEPVSTQPQMVSVEVRSLAETRFGKAIGGQIAIVGRIMHRYNPPNGPAVAGGLMQGYKEVLRSGAIFWLPAPDQISSSEAIDLILARRYGVRSPARRPAWVDSYALPAETPIAATIADLQAKRSAVEIEIAAAEERAAKAAAPRALLYEKDEPLEVVVRAALRELGATVTDPAKAGVEDGLLTYGQSRAALEIKGRKNPIGLSDVRQAVQRASDAKLAAGIEHKPLLIANAECEADPSERGEPLAPNAKTSAENGGVALLGTPLIFAALRQKQEGEFDEAAFWTAVFAAAGVVELTAGTSSTD